MELRTKRNHYLIIFSLVSLIHQSTAAIDSFFLNHYDLKINESEASCRLVNHPNLPEDRRTLAGRDCMCDQDCIEYKDCCKDSRYYYPSQQSQSSEYQCSETAGVYLKTKCSPDWKDEKMAELCEKSNQPLESDDMSLILPVSNQKMRVTYGNAYCAACNFDQDMKSWTAWNMGTACGEAPPNYLKKPIVVNGNDFNAANYDYNSFYNNGYYFGSRMNAANGFGYQIGPGFFLDINLYIYNTSAPEGYSTDTISLPVKIQTNFPTTVNQQYSSNRFKRLSSSIDFKKYFNVVDQIAVNSKFDSYNKKFISRFDNKEFVCEFVGLLPENSEMFTRRCVPFMVNSCPKSYKNKSVIKECSIHTKIVYGKTSKKPYKNKDCARCNGEKENGVGGHPQDTRTALSSVAMAGGSSGAQDVKSSKFSG